MPEISMAEFSSADPWLKLGFDIVSGGKGLNQEISSHPDSEARGGLSEVLIDLHLCRFR